ncbi:mechanosensitive ion channel family protein [Flammeovirga kamogawensis]|uniref:Mechanosensitive ion channel family protein n=1 Tax=Flammeovirga kamogawensis TaxID=373891 RepID=A0ABX8H1A6_9BACT|nr:mechanosensitive ion channel family protein [Flammeovirga kamogawensis]MBB6462576.1 MscS family membrane protein [Flammeovirga kamogawensis]QWG09676.1 mechanosensitive ion channel family protein [Flammeovirga kamogawensis]TRX65189.1 mechanosensitive ion channel [Flammeovirga kamogawensis]
MKNIIVLLVLIFSSLVSFSQQEEKENILESFPNDHDFYTFHTKEGVEYSLSSPYHAFHTHLNFLDVRDFYPDVAAEAFNPTIWSLDRRKELATELKLIYRAKGIYPYNVDLSLQKDYKDKKTNTNRFTISDDLQDIYLVRSPSGNWHYSRFSTGQISIIFNKTYPSYSRKFVKFITKIKVGNQMFMGIRLWQVIALIIVGLLLILAYWMTKLLLSVILKKILSGKHEEYFLWKVINAYETPLMLTILSAAYYWLIPLLLLNNSLSYFLSMASKLVFALSLMVLLYRTPDLFVYQLNFKRKSTSFNYNEQLSPILKSSLRIVALILGVGIALKLLGYNVKNLVAGISVGGLVIAFAAQDTVKNFIGSIMLFTDQPFKVGDYISVDNLDGIVEEIGFRTTKIRTFEDSVVVIPNSMVSDNKVNNKGKRNFRRYMTTISITYNTPREKIEKFVDGIREIVKNHPLTREDNYHVHLYEFAASSLDIYFYMFFKTNTRDVELKSREEVMLAVIKLSEDLGVEFAFPTQTLYLNKDSDSEE